MDLLCLSEEPPPLAGQTLRCYPLGQEAHLAVTPTQVTCLRQEVFAKGQITQPLCSDAGMQRESPEVHSEPGPPTQEITGPQLTLWHCLINSTS
ncbi:unnamed protein product [Arctogadus glacialis]